MSGVSRRDFLRWQGAMGLAAVAPPALWRAAGGWSAIAAAAPASMPTFNVQNYGAFPNGTDATTGFKKAIAAAQAVSGGATVYVPSGTYVFTSHIAGPYSASIQIHKLGAPIVFSGDGESATILQEQVASQTLISVHTDGTVIEGMTLDCQSYEGGSCVGIGSTGLDSNGNAIGGNYVTLQDCTALGSSANKRFTLFFAGPPGASQAHQYFQTNNTVKNCVVHDQIDDDGFSFSFQNNGTIQGITHFGSRLAIFECDNLLVEDYDYTPNNACNQGDAQGVVTNGFFITPPSNNVMIKGFTTSGEGGIIAGLAQQRIATNIQIVDEVFTGTGGSLQIGSAYNVTVQGGRMAGNTLLINPGSPGDNSTPGYPAGTTGVTVSDTTLSHVRVQTAALNPNRSGNTGPPLVEVTFTDCTFDGTTIPGSLFQPTFADTPVVASQYPPGPAAFTVEGATFTNQAGGFALGAQPMPIAGCSASGTTVTLVFDTGHAGLAVGELLAVSGLTGFSSHAPNGVFALTGLTVAGVGTSNPTTTVTYVSTPAPVGTWAKGSGKVAGQPGSYGLVTGCSVSGTTVTLSLDDVSAISADETIAVGGLAGFGTGSGNPNGSYVVATITNGQGKAGTITYTTSSAPTGTWTGGGSVLGIPMTFTISGTAPIDVAPPVVSGPATPGTTLKATTGAWMPTTDGAPSYTYHWFNGKGPIPGATGATYVPTKTDVGSAIGVTVTATNTTGSTAASSQAVTIKSNP